MIFSRLEAIVFNKSMTCDYVKRYHFWSSFCWLVTIVLNKSIASVYLRVVYYDTSSTKACGLVSNLVLVGLVNIAWRYYTCLGCTTMSVVGLRDRYEFFGLMFCTRIDWLDDLSDFRWLDVKY